MSEFGIPGEFEWVTGITSDADGDLWIVDGNQNKVFQYDTDGNYISELGTGISGPASGEFSYPQGIAINSEGHVYVGDMYNNRVQIFGQDGTFLSQIGVVDPYADDNDPTGEDEFNQVGGGGR